MIIRMTRKQFRAFRRRNERARDMEMFDDIRRSARRGFRPDPLPGPEATPYRFFREANESTGFPEGLGLRGAQ